MQLKRKIFAAVSSLAMISAIFLTGCGNNTSTTKGSVPKDTGILTLSVNPEIQISYGKDGNVTAVSGENDDGKKIVASYTDYVGKSCDTVVSELVGKINEAGYFVEDIDGNKKNIVLQLEPGSVIPSDTFLQTVSTSTQTAMANLHVPSNIVTIDNDDYDPAYAQNGNPSPYITIEKAKEIALKQANIQDASVVLFEEKEFDHNDGTPVFELQFTANGIEYEYDIDAVTGKVLRAKHESSNPVTGGNSASTLPNVDDTDYGPNNDGVTDYNEPANNPNDTDYGPNNDGVTDYNEPANNPNDTDYGPNNDGVTDYNNTDYGPNNDGVTDYNPPAPPAPAPADTDYGAGNDGVTDYNPPAPEPDDNDDDYDGDDD